VVPHCWGTRLGVWTRPPAQADPLARGKPGITTSLCFLSRFIRRRCATGCWAARSTWVGWTSPARRCGPPPPPASCPRRSTPDQRCVQRLSSSRPSTPTEPLDYIWGGVSTGVLWDVSTLCFITSCWIIGVVGTGVLWDVSTLCCSTSSWTIWGGGHRCVVGCQYTVL
jgi:hypothetical protein